MMCMGLQKKKLHALLPIIVMVMVVIGVGATIALVSLPPPRVEAADVFADDVFVEDSDAGGSVSVSTVLKDTQGTVIRRTLPDIYAMPYQIVDPDTKEEVKFYAIELGYDCWGKNIDWTTFSLQGTWKYSKYVGVTDQGNAWAVDKSLELNTQSVISPDVGIEGTKEVVNGIVTFPDQDITTLMPDKITYSYHDYDIDTGAKILVVENWNQKTSWSHAIQFVFDCDFKLTVKDSWGNAYDSSYNLHIVLKMLWAGSDFAVTWDTGTTTTTTTETETIPPPTDELPDPEPTLFLPPEDVLKDPITDLTTDERIYLTNTDTADILGAALTGSYGSAIVVVGVLFIMVPIVVYLWFRRK